MNSFDISWFSFWNGIAGKNFWLDIFVVFIGGTWLISILFICAFWILWGDRTALDLFRRLSMFVGSLIVSEFFVQAIRLLYNRPRPFQILPITNQLLFHSNGWSFPSSHAAIAFAIAATVFFVRPLWGIFFFLGAGLVAIGRVVGGVHWPTDVIVGSLIGIISALVIFKALQKHKK